jgi:hypothetical protein
MNIWRVVIRTPVIAVQTTPNVLISQNLGNKDTLGASQIRTGFVHVGTSIYKAQGVDCSLKSSGLGLKSEIYVTYHFVGLGCHGVAGFAQLKHGQGYREGKVGQLRQVSERLQQHTPTIKI